MILQICAVRDAVHREYSNIILESSEASAIRNFSSSVLSSAAKEEGLLYSHPQDFSLWCLGTFDNDTGEFLIHKQPFRLIEAGEIHG